MDRLPNGFVCLCISALLVLVARGAAGQCPTQCKCENSDTKVTCDIETKLTALPDLPASTQVIVMMGKQPNDGLLASLTKADLAKYVNLTEITLSGLGLTSLASDCFSAHPKLKRIDLSDNDLALLPDNVFQDLNALFYLDLKQNRLETITSSQLNLPSLSLLALSGNSIKLNDSTIFQHLRKLETLFLSDNYIGEPIPEYTGPNNLQSVIMDNCSISTLSVNLVNFVANAVRLSLRRNKIVTLPPGFLHSLPNLREFHLDNNEIETLKNDMFKNDGNADFYARFVTLENNNISVIEPNAFKSFRTALLKLDNNRLSNLPRDLFAPLGSDLTKLYLRANPLTVLKAGTFSNLTGLQTLRLDSAQLVRIEDGAFSGMAFPDKSVGRIDLSKNNLTSLSNDTLNVLDGLKTVDLTQNQWNCTEQLVDLRRWLVRNGQSQDCEFSDAKNCLKCASPEKFAGRLVVNLTETELITAMDPPTTTPEPTTPTPEPTTPEPTTPETTTLELTTPEPATDNPITPEPTPPRPTPAGTAPNRTAGGPDIYIYIYVAAAVTVALLFLVLTCLCIKTWYHSREVTYPLARKELENGYVPETGEKQDDSVQLEHVFTIEGHANPGFKLGDEDDLNALGLGASTTSLSTFRPGRNDPCRDSGIVGDSPGSNQSINRPLQAWEGRAFGYENRTYSNLDEYT